MQEKNNQTKSERDCFREKLCSHVITILGEGYETEVSVTRKNNDVMKDVLYIRKENNECVPCFYLDELYASYCMGENEWMLAETLANIVKGECERVARNAKEFVKKDWIVDHLFVLLVHKEKNKACLVNAVYETVLDLAAVFYVLTEVGPDGVKSFQLPLHIWNELELGTPGEYFPKALENTRRLFPENLFCLEQVLSIGRGDNETEFVTALRKVESEEPLLESRLYVLSNTEKIFGAASILYPELLKTLGERFSGDYYVIPGSVHEVLLMKATEEDEEERLNRIVREVNALHVEPEEILSEHVYYYARKEECFKVQKA